MKELFESAMVRKKVFRVWMCVVCTFVCGCIRGVSRIMACGPVCCRLSSTPAWVMNDAAGCHPRQRESWMTLQMFSRIRHLVLYIPLHLPQNASVPHFPLRHLASSPSPNNPSLNLLEPTSDLILCVRIHRRLRPCDWICQSTSLLIAIYRTNSIICRITKGLGTSNSTAHTCESYMRMRKVKFQASWQREEASHHLQSQIW
jgi:hypothetical protein